MNLTKAERELARAANAVSRELEQWLTDTVVRLARRYPGKRVRAVSAMGTWTLDIDDVPRYPPVFKAFERVESEWGWNAIPAPVWIESSDGGATIQRKTDW